MPIDRLLSGAARWARIALCVVAVGLVALYLVYPSTPGEQSGEGGQALQRKGRALFPYEAIGSGMLALHPRHPLGWVSRLADELILIAYNSRPDMNAQESKILLSLKHGREQLTLSSGESLYLKESEEGKGLLASDAPTGLFVKPILLDNGAVLVEAGRQLLFKDGKTGEEKGQFILAQQGGVPSRFSPAQHLFYKELKEAHGFSGDLIIQKYGGREFAHLNEKAVLEIAHGNGSYACFVSAGDYLIYEGEEWRICPRTELKRECPIAYIRKATPSDLEIEAWDETGFSPVQVRIAIERPGRFQPKPEMMPSRIRLRSSSQVSCAFGKRRVILRQGDWLLKTSNGWRNLRRSDEIEQYLARRLKGELFIFDSIEKEQGRSVIKGNLFDETRTQVQPLMLPIEAEKPEGKTTRKRKPFLQNATRKAA